MRIERTVMHDFISVLGKRIMIIERCWFMRVIRWFYVPDDRVLSGETESMTLWHQTVAGDRSKILPHAVCDCRRALKLSLISRAAISLYKVVQEAASRSFLLPPRIKIHLSLLIESAPDHWLSHYKPPPTAVQRRNRQWIIASTTKRKKTRQESFITSIAWFTLDPGSPAPIVVSAIIRKCQIRTRKAELRTASPTFSIKIARIYLDQN